jgi:hypothetical protein
MARARERNPMTRDIVVARTTFFIGNEKIHRGQTYYADDSRIVGMEHNFKPFKVDNEIEQATAAPGEKRSTRIRKESKPETAEPAEEQTPEPVPEQSTEGSTDATEYSDLKQPELKALLNERGIEYPNGVVSNADLIALLESKPETAE